MSNQTPINPVKPSSFLRGFQETMQDVEEAPLYSFKPQKLDHKVVDLLARLMASANSGGVGLSKLLESLLMSGLAPKDIELLKQIPDAQVLAARDKIFTINRSGKKASGGSHRPQAPASRPVASPSAPVRQSQGGLPMGSIRDGGPGVGGGSGNPGE